MAEFTKISGASRVFSGGLVAYANRTKQGVLGVSGAALRRYGAVSRPVVLQMARGARRRFKTQWALSVSGVAGPTGGTKLKPVGLVFLAVAGPGFERAMKKTYRGSRVQIQKQAVVDLFRLLLTNL